MPLVFRVTAAEFGVCAGAADSADNVLLAELNNYCLGGVYISLVIWGPLSRFKIGLKDMPLRQESQLPFGNLRLATESCTYQAH